MGSESKAVENPQCVGFRNDLNGGVAKSLVCKNMDCHTLLRSVCNDAVEGIAVEHNVSQSVDLVDTNANYESISCDVRVGSKNNARSSKVESKDFKALGCEENKMAEKGIDNEKTSQNIQGKTLYARGCNNANECASRTTSSSDSTLYRNDLSACEITQSEVCVQEKSKVSFVGLNAKQIYRQLKKKSPIIASYVFLFRKFKILKASAYH